MSKEIFDFSEALRRMKEGKKVRRVIWEECGAYIHIVSETIVAVCDGKFFPCVFKDSEDILATDWEEVGRMKKKILTLTIDKQWFDMVVSGKKKEEYRVIKGYWAKRLLLVRSELEEPFEKMSKECAENWDSISIEMAKHCFISPYYKTAPYTHVLFINGYRKDSPRIERRLRVSPLASQRKAYAPTSGLILSFLLLNSSSV